MAAECQEEIARLREEVGRLREEIVEKTKRIKDLEAQNLEIADEYVEAENGRLDLEEAIDRAYRVVGEAMELTISDGPKIGMTHVAQWWLDESGSRITGMQQIPYDWLSRWAS